MKFYKYTIILVCNVEKDEMTYGRHLNMNDYDTALRTYKTLVKGAMEDLIDGYKIEMINNSIVDKSKNELMYSFVKE